MCDALSASLTNVTEPHWRGKKVKHQEGNVESIWDQFYLPRKRRKNISSYIYLNRDIKLDIFKCVDR